MTGRIWLIAGPTASGKSALALELVARLDGTVINTDSMQVYRDLRIITARPGPGEEARVPWVHWLEAKHPGVGVYEGAAGRVKGAWRPTTTG